MRYVAECVTCERVKALSIHEWKWEDIYMDFIVGLSHTLRGYDYMGHCGSFDKVSPFHTHMHQVQG
jgi:hypothetical protein